MLERKTVRPAMEVDMPEILPIFEYARKFMAETGNPTQWGSNRPNPELLWRDIECGQLYVVEADGNICGVFALIIGPDPTYTYIKDGQWHDDEIYGTIHRLASNGSGGVFDACMDFCARQCAYLRIDTHRDNRIMQHLVEKAGFRYCGIIYVDDGTERLAYDRKR